MTDDGRRPDGTHDPSWSVDLLADVHGEVLDPAETARLRQAAATDPRAALVLAALDEVRGELAALGSEPVPPMPAHYAARLDAALAALPPLTGPVPSPQQVPHPFSQQPPQRQYHQQFHQPPQAAPVVNIDAARRRRAKRMAWGGGILVGAAAAVAAVTAVVLPSSDNGDGGGPVGAAPNTAQPISVSRTDISAAIGDVTDKRDFGALKNDGGLIDCLGGSDIVATPSQIGGIRQVRLDGVPGVMALLVGDNRIRVVVVPPDCTADNSKVLLDQSIVTGLPKPSK